MMQAYLALHNFDVAYFDDVKPKVVDFTFGRSSIMVPLRLLLEPLTVIRPRKLSCPASLVNTLKRVDDIFANRCSRRLHKPIRLQSY